MQGRLVVLEWPDVTDYDLIARWLKPLSPMAALTGDVGEFLSAEQLRSVNEQGNVRYFMVRTHDGEKIGVVNYRSVGSAGSFSIGGAVGEWKTWNKGHGAEGLGLLVDYLFHAVNAHRVEFTTAAFNRHTMKILTKGGFTLEGVLRDFHFIDGKYYDRTIWSILRDEFYANAAENTYFPVEDAIPEADKIEAHEAFAKYLANQPLTSLASFDERGRQRRTH